MIERFIDYIAIEKRYSPMTVKAYRTDLEELCDFLKVRPYEAARNQEEQSLPVFDPTLLTDEDLRMWLVDMLDKGQKARSVRRKVSAIRSFWRFLLLVDVVHVDIARMLISPKMEKTLPTFFKPEEMHSAEQLMQYADDFTSIRDNLIIEMLYETGMRRSEMVSLKDDDVDLSQKQLRVFGKRRKERIIPFGDKLRQQIQEYIAVRNEYFGTEAPALLLSAKGLPLGSNSLYKIVRTRMGEVSIQQKLSPHVLRHTFATAMLNNGADIRTIQTLLGHASIATTEIYTHASFEQVRHIYQQAHPRNKK